MLKRNLAIIISGTMLFFAKESHALTLNEALLLTYHKHPELLAARENVKATDENAPQAFAGWLPSSSFAWERGEQDVDRGSSGGDNLIDDKNIDVTQPLYKGGRTVATMRKADNEISQAQFDLISTEQNLLIETVEVYMSVVRAQEHLSLAKHNQKLFSKELEQAKERFKLGEISKVDLAEAEVKLAEAVTERIEAEHDVQTSYAEYEEVIGEHPTSVELPKNRVEIQTDIKNMVQMALDKHPSIKAKEFEIEAAKNGIDVEKSYILPSVNLIAGRNERNATSFTGSTAEIETDSIRVQVSVPLFNTSARGAEHSRIRQAERYYDKARYELTDTKNEVKKAVVRAYQDLKRTQETTNTIKTRINAANIVLAGIKAEERAGAKTLVDVLEAKQTLFEAKDDLINNEVDEIIYAYHLLARMGKLTVKDLQIETDLYNPDVHRKDVQHQLIGF